MESREDVVCKSGRVSRMEARNDVLVARYFYWTEIRRRRFDDVISILENNEFFVEYQTIAKTVAAYDAYYVFFKGMLPGGAAKKYLRKHYPSWNWN